MPLQRCESEGRPGWKWGESGKCYTFTSGDEESETQARRKALAQAAAMGEFPGTGQESRTVESVDPVRAPVEYRDISSVANVNFAQRLIEVVAVPYEERAIVEWRGEMWEETFARGAFDGIEKRPNRIRANRDHDRSRTVGKAVKFWPSREEGLVAGVRIGKTLLGDETLALADEDMLSASVGFAALGRDQDLDKRNKIRRIKKAFLDHISFVEAPAYAGANVLSVRGQTPGPSPSELPKLVTPSLDELVAWHRAHRREP